MGKIDQFSIIFDKKDPIYFNGDVLTGKVQVNVTERIKIKGLFLCLNGETTVHWYKTSY